MCAPRNFNSFPVALQVKVATTSSPWFFYFIPHLDEHSVLSTIKLLFLFQIALLQCSMHKLFRIPICFIYKSFVMSIYYKERQSSTDLNWKGICVRLVKLDDVTRWAKEPASDAQIGPISVFSRLTWWALNITSWKQDLSWEIATILNIQIR